MTSRYGGIKETNKYAGEFTWHVYMYSIYGIVHKRPFLKKDKSITFTLGLRTLLSIGSKHISNT